MAFRSALKAKFNAITLTDPRYNVDDLQRQFAYDCLLARVFSMPDADRWVLKGAGALLARLDIRIRHTKDIDLYFAQRDAAADDAAQAVQRAARLDLGDHLDIALIAQTQHVSGSDLRTALLTGTAHRDIPFPAELHVPTQWRDGYRKVADGVPMAPDFDAAGALARRFVNPVLAEPLIGHWNSRTLGWSS